MTNNCDDTPTYIWIAALLKDVGYSKLSKIVERDGFQYKGLSAMAILIWNKAKKIGRRDVLEKLEFIGYYNLGDRT